MSSTNPLIEAPKPGYLTSEFWTTLLVHALAVATTLLDLLHVHWAHGLSGTQAAVPVIAMIVSATLQAAYHDKRNAVKIDHAAQLARTYVAEVENGYHEVAPEITQVAGLVHTYTTGTPGGYVSTIVNAVAPEAAPFVAEAEKVADEVATTTEKVNTVVEQAIPPALPVPEVGDPAPTATATAGSDAAP